MKDQAKEVEQIMKTLFDPSQQKKSKKKSSKRKTSKDANLRKKKAQSKAKSLKQ